MESEEVKKMLAHLRSEKELGNNLEVLSKHIIMVLIYPPIAGRVEANLQMR